MNILYDQGLANEKNEDYEHALQFYEQAAEQGDDRAECRIGHIYRFGRGVTKNYEKALYWYNRAAEKGNALAQSNLGSMYRFGQGVAKDYAAAIEWYKLSAKQNNEYAQQNLGSMYRFGEGVSRDAEAAIYWYTLSANQNNMFAQANLGTLYRLGEGVDLDYKQAFYWYSRSASQGYAYAKYLLALLYYHGHGVEQDFVEAFRLLSEYENDKFLDFKKNGEAFYYLGECYRNGFGTEKDLKKAKKYYLQAIEYNYNCNYALQIIRSDLHEASDRNLMREYADCVNKQNLPLKEMYIRVSKDLEKEFGATWNMLAADSKKFLVSGMMTYLSFCSVGGHIYGNLDFSAVIIQIFKAVEKELGKYLYTNYICYLRFHQISPNSFLRKRSFLKKVSAKEYAYKKETDLSEFTCGNIHLTIGLEKNIEEELGGGNTFVRGSFGCIDRSMLDY